MRRSLLIKAMKLWLLIVCIILPLFVYASGEKGPEKAPKAITGAYVDDPSISVPAGAYTTFSTVYNGKRYYLGIDTTQAKSGKDTVAWYNGPCYAAMWKVGGIYSPTGKVLTDQNYLRAIQSVWIEEKCTDHRKRYLTIGPDKGSYSPLMLCDTAHSSMWYTLKDESAQSKYLQGYLYYYSDATGVEISRYLNYDPLYGFSRATSRVPSASQRISVWDRKTGSDLIFDVQPRTLTAGYETNNHDTTKYPITSRVIYYENVDRFRSRFDHTDVYAAISKPIEDQTILQADPYNMIGYYEWQSNPTVNPEKIPAYNGKSSMKVWKPVLQLKDGGNPEDYEVVEQWGDSTMFYVSETRFKLDEATNIWHEARRLTGRSAISCASAARAHRRQATTPTTTTGCT